MTPVELRNGIWFKRDDLYHVAGTCGGKARAAWAMAQGAHELVTAGARQSPQVMIVARIAQELGIPCRCHIPAGADTAETAASKACGAVLVRHSAGYNSVIVARAREDAERSGARLIPFGMECLEAIEQTSAQTGNIPPECSRIIVPVGSGMSLAGILTGLARLRTLTPVIGIVVGADPTRRLNRFAPWWHQQAELVPAGVPYALHCKHTDCYGVNLDPVYEAKCIPFLRPGDLLWCVGHRWTT